MCVAKALDAVESFNTPHAQLALDGGTCLSAYHRCLLRRFSEDIDLRIRPSPAAVESIGRVEALKAAGAAFRDHVAEALPWLALTRKGRVRRDGVVQSFILPIRTPHAGPGAWCPGSSSSLWASPGSARSGSAAEQPVSGQCRPWAPLEIAAGKWAALAPEDSGRLMAHGARSGTSCA